MTDDEYNEDYDEGYSYIPDPDYLIKTYSDMTEQQKAEYAVWLATRPQHIREACEKTPPYIDYTLTTTGKRARIYSVDEDMEKNVTFTILTHNSQLGLVKVFGIKPAELVPIIQG